MRLTRILRILSLQIIAALSIGANSDAFLPQAQARWKAEFGDAPYSAWYKQQHDSAGWSCCERSDAHAVYDAYIREGRWYVPIEGTDHEVPPHLVLDGPNPTGHAVVWYDGEGDHIDIFCFAPGPMY
jgi:hypothetical protein